MSNTLSKKKRRHDDTKKIVGDIQSQFEVICQHISSVVEYLQITEMRLKKLEDIINQNCEDVNQLKSSLPYKSPEFNTMPYIPWAKRDTSPLPEADSFDINEIDWDAAEKEMDSLCEYSEEPLFCMSPLDLTEPSLFCDEVMESE